MGLSHAGHSPARDTRGHRVSQEWRHNRTTLFSILKVYTRASSPESVLLWLKWKEFVAAARLTDDDVTWTDMVLNVGPQRSRDLRGGRWSWTLNFAQKSGSWVGRWSWAEQVGRLLLRVVQAVHQQQCNGHCLSDSVQHSSWNSNCAAHKSLGNGEGIPP